MQREGGKAVVLKGKRRAWVALPASEERLQVLLYLSVLFIHLFCLLFLWGHICPHENNKLPGNPERSWLSLRRELGE